MALLFGVLAAAFYGSADFFGGFASRRASYFAVTLLAQGIGFAVLLAAMLTIPMQPTPENLGWGALAGICGGLGIAFLYRALAIGRMGVVSPISAVLAAGVPVVFGALHGEHLNLAQSFGILLALIAIVAISASFDPSGAREISTEGVREAIASGFILGGFYVFLGSAGPHAGLAPLIGARITSVLTLLVLSLWMRADMRPHGMLWWIVICGALDMLANILYVLAAEQGVLAIAAVLTSLYPAATALLARVFLNERLSRIQYAGFALAIAGVVLLAR